MAKRPWSELTRPQQTAVVVLGIVEVALTTVAMIDLVRRPSALVRGPKLAWAVGCVVQPVGPIAYLALGRKDV